MPGFRTHTAINVTVLAGLVTASLADGRFSNGLVAVAAASFLVATVFLSPDLDLRQSSPTRNWGLLRWLWRPYQLVFKHRGVSHNLFLSSITRVAYLLGLIVVGCALARLLAGAALPTQSEALAFAGRPAAAVPSFLREGLWVRRAPLAAAGTGIFLSDTTHIVADRVVSAVKKIASI
jgi:uncharacterized metal-binding protein